MSLEQDKALLKCRRGEIHRPRRGACQHTALYTDRDTSSTTVRYLCSSVTGPTSDLCRSRESAARGAPAVGIGRGGPCGTHDRFESVRAAQLLPLARCAHQPIGAPMVHHSRTAASPRCPRHVHTAQPAQHIAHAPISLALASLSSPRPPRSPPTPPEWCTNRPSLHIVAHIVCPPVPCDSKEGWRDHLRRWPRDLGGNAGGRPCRA